LTFTIFSSLSSLDKTLLFVKKINIHKKITKDIKTRNPKDEELKGPIVADVTPIL
jgi:hypothetical protein